VGGSSLLESSAAGVLSKSEAIEDGEGLMGLMGGLDFDEEDFGNLRRSLRMVISGASVESKESEAWVVAWDWDSKA